MPLPPEIAEYFREAKSAISSAEAAIEGVLQTRDGRLTAAQKQARDAMDIIEQKDAEIQDLRASAAAADTKIEKLEAKLRDKQEELSSLREEFESMGAAGGVATFKPMNGEYGAKHDTYVSAAPTDHQSYEDAMEKDRAVAEMPYDDHMAERARSPVCEKHDGGRRSPSRHSCSVGSNVSRSIEKDDGRKKSGRSDDKKTGGKPRDGCNYSPQRQKERKSRSRSRSRHGSRPRHRSHSRNRSRRRSNSRSPSGRGRSSTPPWRKGGDRDHRRGRSKGRGRDGGRGGRRERSRGRGGGGGDSARDVPLCISYVMEGRCQYGDKCRHMRLDEENCRAAKETLRAKPCRFGEQCKRKDCIFRHPGRSPGR